MVPADEATREDLQAVLGTRGAGSRCQCQRFRLGRGESFGSFPQEERADRLRQQADPGHPGGPTSGLVGYLGPDPVGWCAVAPRSSYDGLVRVFRVPWDGRDEDRTDPSVWAVTCVFTRAGFRRRGVSRAMVAATVDHARGPRRPGLGGLPDHHDRRDLRGAPRRHLASFEAAGFRVVSRPSATSGGRPDRLLIASLCDPRTMASARRAVTPDTLGAWVLKASPRLSGRSSGSHFGARSGLATERSRWRSRRATNTTTAAARTTYTKPETSPTHLLHDVPLRAQHVAGDDQGAVPEQAAGEGVADEGQQRHPVDAGRDRDQAADARHQPAQEDRAATVAAEPVDRALDVVGPHQRQPLRGRHHPLQPPRHARGSRGPGHRRPSRPSPRRRPPPGCSSPGWR